MIEDGVSLELKVESAVVLGSIAKGTEDNIRSLIDGGAVSVLFKGSTLLRGGEIAQWCHLGLLCEAGI